MKIGDMTKSADWKSEKHAPVIEAPSEVLLGAAFKVEVSVGKEIAHPNTVEHHIAWLQLFFQPAAGAVYEVAKFAFTAHGESTKGANQGPVLAEPHASATLKLTESGELIALSYCNLHGLWESSTAIKVK
jgi:superoxide reductase